MNRPRQTVKPSFRRIKARLGLERLEERLVLSTIDLTGGVLSYTAAAGQANNVLLSYNSGTNVDTLSDSGDTITLTANAIAAGVTVDGTQQVATIPDGPVFAFLFDTGDSTDTFHIQSAVEPITFTPTNNAGGTQTIFLGNASNGVQDILASVTVNDALGSTTLNVDDSANTTSGLTVTTTNTTISGLLPANTITVGADALSNLNLLGGTQVNSFIFGGTLAPATTVNPGANFDAVNVHQLNAGATLSVTGQNTSVAVGNVGILTDVLGQVDVQNSGSPGTTNVTVDDSADATSRSINIQDNQTTGFNASGSVTYNPANLRLLTVNGGTGGNTFTIASTVPGVTNTFNTGTGIDTVLLEATGAGSTVNINSQNGADTVTIGNAGLTSGILGSLVNISNPISFTDIIVDDSNDTNPTTATIGATQISGLTSGPINYVVGAVNSLLVKGGNGGNNFTISNAGSNGYPTSITSGSGSDLFSFTNGATLDGGTIDGGAGIDSLDYSAYTTAVFVNLNATPQIATGTDSVSNIESVANGGSGGNTLTAPAGVDSTLVGGSGDDTFIIPANAGNVVLNGNGGTDALQIIGVDADNFTQTSSAGRIEVVVSGTSTTHTIDAGGVNSIDLVGGTGNTTATIDFSGGNPIPAGGETYTGGGGTSNTLVLVNDVPGAAPFSFTDEVYDSFGPGEGIITFDGTSEIIFSGLSPIIDSVTVQNYTFNAPPAINNISITAAGSVNGFTGTLIASNDPPAAFESAAIANKTNVTINAIDDTDTAILVNDAGTTVGLATLSINTGNGNDFVNLISTPAVATLSVNSGSGTDTFNVNAAGLGAPATINSSTATSTLIYDAGNLTTTGTAATLQSGTFPTLTFTNITTVIVNNIADLTIVSTPRTAIPIQTGHPFTGVVGSFTVPAPGGGANQLNPVEQASDFVASINWGDGTPSTAGTVVANGTGGFDVIGSHTYLSITFGTTPITVTVTHNASTSSSTVNGITTTLQTNGGSSTTIASTAFVRDTPIIATGVFVIATEGQPLPATVLLATFVDPDPTTTLANFTATVNWNDGTGEHPVTVQATGTAGNYNVVALNSPHIFNDPGTFPVTVTITDASGGVATTQANAIIADAGLIATGIPVTGSENVPLINVPVASFVDLGGAENVNNYTATIDWGDGTVATQGLISFRPIGATFVVTGSHTYTDPGSFSIHVTIRANSGAQANVVTTATIADVPFTITTTLDSFTDSGVSNTDNITNVTQPIFNGSAEPGSIVRLFSSGSTPLTLIGIGVADAAGRFSIRSNFLADGIYVITATATDPNNPLDVTGPTVLLGGTVTSPLVIDTTGPLVTEAIFRRPLGQVIVAFQDFGGGMTPAQILDGIAFRFTTYAKATFPPNLITRIQIIGSGAPNDPIQAILTINRGRPLRSGRYELTIRSAALTDTAGNALDGDYYGFTPSGNGKAGGDFHALLVSNRSFTFGALPTQTTVTPKNPPGKKPPGYSTPNIQKVNVHDAALAQVVVAKKKKHK